MNALLAVIVEGRQAIVVINIEAVEIFFLLYFIDSTKTLQRRPRPTPSIEAPRGEVCLSTNPMLLEGKMAHHGGDVCVPVVTTPGSIYSTSIVDNGTIYSWDEFW